MRAGRVTVCLTVLSRYTFTLSPHCARHFLEAQEARLTGRPLPDDHPDKAKEARGAKSSRRIPPAEV